MNIQIYYSKKNPGVLKAERFFKERGIPYQLIDLHKHKPGRKELDIFVRAAGAKALVDRHGRKAQGRAVAHMTTESLIVEELLQDPTAMISPIVRNGQYATSGVDEVCWTTWLNVNA